MDDLTKDFLVESYENLDLWTATLSSRGMADGRDAFPQHRQQSAQEAVEAIGKIGEVINQINDISNTIASAVEQQSLPPTKLAAMWRRRHGASARSRTISAG